MVRYVIFGVFAQQILGRIGGWVVQGGVVVCYRVVL